MKYVSFTNNGSLELSYNMILSLRKFTDEEMIMFCLDDESENFFIEKNIKNVTVKTSYKFKSNYWDYGTQEFKLIMFIKLKCILDTLNEINENIFFIDSDVFFAKDPTEKLKQIENDTHDMICQTDRPVGSRWCAGVMLLKNNNTIKQLFQEAIQIANNLAQIKTDSGEWHDQAILNHILARGDIKLNTLETTFATNGHLYFSNNGPKERLGQTIIHANFCVGTQQKIEWFKSENMWII